MLYLGVATFLYCWEYPPKWYCRLRWQQDRYPFFNPKKIPKSWTFVLALSWPMTLSVVAIFLTIRDTVFVLKLSLDKIKDLLKGVFR